MIFRTVSFAEIKFHVDEWKDSKVRTVLIDMACQYLMDTEYPEFNECDVITNYRDIAIDWFAHTVIIPVNQVYKPEYLH